MPRKKPDRPLVYWDACVFLAFITNEKRPAGDMEGLYSVAKAINKGEMDMITSVQTLSEVLEGSLTKEQEDRFQSLFNRSNIQLINIDQRIANKTRELRNYYMKQKRIDKRPVLCQADAHHLATALLFEVDEFHTFDKNDSHGCRGLLGLSGNVAGYPLTICKPSTIQFGLL